jgi:hypothetical protein
MARNSSATPREEKSTANQETSTRNPKASIPHQETSTPTAQKPVRASRSCADETSVLPVDASLKRRARLLITKSSIPKQTRSLIRYALGIKDPHLAQVVRRVEDGEMTIDSLYIE